MRNIFRVGGKCRLQKLLISLIVAFGAGAIGSFFSRDAKLIYESLNLPPFAPPAVVFGIVWPILFFLMAIASYRVWMYTGASGLKEQGPVRNALGYYMIQLFFNILWSVLFFGLGLSAAALADALILLFYIILTAVKFRKIDKPAACLMALYSIWAAYAAVLNICIIVLN